MMTMMMVMKAVLFIIDWVVSSWNRNCLVRK